MKKSNLNIITSLLSVEPIMINSNLVSAQNRSRYYWCNWAVNQPADKGVYLKDIIENGDFYLVKNQGKTLCQKINKATTLLARDYKGFGNQGQTGVYVNDTIRKLTVIECERLQTLPDNYTEGISNTQRIKAIGNGWTVAIIEHLFKELFYGY